MPEKEINTENGLPPTQSAGDYLRRARLQRGWSIEQVAAQLKLTCGQVEALESDRHDKLPGSVFVRGFLRNYARLLGLDPEEVVRIYASQSGDAGTRSAQQLVPKAEGPLMEHSWRTVLWALLALAVIVGMVLFFYGNSSELPDADDLAFKQLDGQAAGPAAASSPADPAAAALSPASAPVVSAAAPLVSAPAAEPAHAAVAPTASALPPAAAGGKLNLQFSAEAWVEVRDSTGKILLRRTAQAGEQADLQGEAPYRIVLGNAAAAQIRLGDMPVPVPGGKPGQVVHFTVGDTSAPQPGGTPE